MQCKDLVMGEFYECLELPDDQESLVGGISVQLIPGNLGRVHLFSHFELPFKFFEDVLTREVLHRCLLLVGCVWVSGFA